MKNILILGCPRVGKSLLANAIKNRLPHYNIISGDALRIALKQTFNKDYSKRENRPEFIQFLINTYLVLEKSQEYNKDNKNNYFIFDCTELRKEDVALLQQSSNPLIVFVGKPKLSAEELYLDIRAKENKFAGWTRYKDDETLKQWAESYAKRTREEFIFCSENKILYLDTSFNQNQKIKKFADKIAKLVEE